jgi:hypothetical protein
MDEPHKPETPQEPETPALLVITTSGEPIAFTIPARVDGEDEDGGEPGD